MISEPPMRCRHSCLDGCSPWRRLDRLLREPQLEEFLGLGQGGEEIEAWGRRSAELEVWRTNRRIQKASNQNPHPKASQQKATNPQSSHRMLDLVGGPFRKEQTSLLLE